MGATTSANDGHSSDSLRTEEEVLFDPNASGCMLVCSMYQDQRPLKGVVGLLDWRLRGQISKLIINGRITGENGEVVYFPLRYRNAIRHLLFLGLGDSSQSEKKFESTAAEVLERIEKVAKNMRFDRVAISTGSFPFLKGHEKSARKKLSIEVEWTKPFTEAGRNNT